MFITPRAKVPRAAILAGALLAAGQFVRSAAAQGVSTQAAPATTSPAAGSSWLRVVAENARVYSRPDVNSLAVTEMERDEVLRSVALDEYGWHRVLPPPGVFSFVAAEFIEREAADRGVVRVSSSSLRVRVGSLLRDVDPLQCEVQTRLERGDSVRIVGEHGPWLRIIPPEGVVFYVHQNAVEPISEEIARRLLPRTPRTAATRPASVAATPPAAGRPATGPDLSGPWGQRLLLAETAIHVESRKDALTQSWTEHIARLRPIAGQREEPQVARLAEAWLAQIEWRLSEVVAIREAEEILRHSAREDARRDRELARIQQAEEHAARGSVYAARGQLLRSLVVEAEGGTRLFRLQDPVTRRFEAYVEVPAEARSDAERWVGLYVGVRGERRASAQLGADIVRASEFVGLEPPGATTAPTRQ